MTQSIETFSLEAVILGGFSAIVLLTELLSHAHMLLPTGSRLRGWTAWTTKRLDRFLAAFHRNAPVIPWMLAALLISVIAPVYDMYTDVGWADEVLKSGGGQSANGLNWPRLLQNSHERTLATLMHVSQTAIVLLILWSFSVLWNLAFVNSRRSKQISKSRAGRWGFLGAFVYFIVNPTLDVLDYLGNHAEILYRLPAAAPA
ncbi:MAG: hypothetical protein ACREB7_11740 [Sphingopyxis sp.]|uniref:hypothetical protein n=1 Tax=Sphingopyxis sp. TaxID=1908224 RepID=UPI003D6D0C21